MQTADPLVPEPNCFEVEVAIEKLKRYKWPGMDQIWQNWSKQEVIHYVLRSTNFLTLFGTRKNCHTNGRNLLLYRFIKRVVKWTVVTVEGYHCYQPHTKILSNICLKVSSLHSEIIGNHQCGFNIIDWLLIRYSAFVRYWRKNGSIMRQYISYL
jgi:hypothetical protein